ncbi:MAG: DUF2510 domain-containing protein [Microcella sp.]|uniref:DUF2510 domain-containing protein n=1 Tax=Microcella sp. TaxID=1913979 RepID=UPI0024CD8FA7|nr:DUF2510 domain-containing protein [Microcella sp.]UYN84034.1 MAG: DUF2510 domain-containing protein [Microcella sp.]
MSAPAPGWYADADDPALIRWWDGSMWSDHTQPNPAYVSSTATAEPPPFAAPISASAPVPPPFAEPAASPTVAPAATPTPAPTPSPAPELPMAAAPFVPPMADAAPPRRDARGSSSPSLPISEPVRLVPPTSAALPGAAPLPSGAAESGSFGAAPLSPGSFAAAPLASVAPAPPSASTPWTSSPSFAQPAASVDLASVDYEPMVRSWGAARSGSATRTVTGVTTAGAWMLALSPLFQVGLLGLGWVLSGGGTSAVTSLVAGGLALVAVLWVVLGAVADYRRLGALGHEYRPSILWILLGPLMYLVARAIHVYRTAGRGVAPTWVYLVLSIVVGAAAGTLGALLPRDASLAELRQVESTITTELQQQGVDYTVLCPDETTAAVGASFVCTAYDEVGPVALVRVTWSGLPGVFSFALESGATAS